MSNHTDTIKALRDALTDERTWLEDQRKSISKGNGSSWDMMQCSERINLINAALTADASEDAPEVREVDHADMPPYVVSMSKQKLWNWFSRSTNALATQFHTRNRFFSATTGLHHSGSAMLGDHGAIIAAQRKRIHGLEVQMGQMQKGYAKKLKKAARPAPVAATPAPDLSNVLSAVLWLYHRLPRGYERQAHIERVVTELAQATGSDAETLLAELGRAAAPAAPIAEVTCHCTACLNASGETADFLGMQVPIAGTMMVLCQSCGNKRCPHANDHRNTCTNSNEPGQAGSSYWPTIEVMQIEGEKT